MTEFREPDQILIAPYIDEDKGILAIGITEHGKRTQSRFKVEKTAIELVNIGTLLIKTGMELAEMEVKKEGVKIP